MSGPRTRGGGARAVLGREVFRLLPRRTWPGVIDSAGLPGEVSEGIREIVRLTGLWDRERVDVARELIAHARDAIELGAEPAAVVGGLGEARVVARLIRRTVRRKRHWLWHARVWVQRSIGVAVGLSVLVAGGLIARTMLSTPSPSRDYFAALNARFEHLPAEERAWPIYKDAYFEIERKRVPLHEELWKRAEGRRGAGFDSSLSAETAGLDLVPRIDPAHPDYLDVLALLEEIRPVLEKVKRGAGLPMVGLPLSTRREELVDETPGLLPESIPEPDDVAEQGDLLAILLPHLSPMRRLARWLAFDARVAAGEGDADRAAGALLAIQGLARQAYDEPFLITTLTSFAIDGLGLRTLTEILKADPWFFDRHHLVEFAHVLGVARDHARSFTGETERMMFDDFLQRAFTDNGRGDGHITARGMKLFQDYSSLATDGIPFSDLATAAGLITVASRAEHRRVYDELLAAARADVDGGYRIYRGWPRRVLEWRAANENRISLAGVGLLAPEFGRVVDTHHYARLRLEGVMAAIGAEMYRRAYGEWPGSVADLEPRFMPFVPEDPFDGRPLRLVIRDGSPVIYSIGPDGVDDGGVRGDFAGRNPLLGPAESETRGGDIVLYPPG